MLRPSTRHKLHILTLSGFALAQPLYDLLGKNAEFFSVRGSDTSEIVLVTLFLSALIPAALIVIVESGRLFGQRAWLMLHAVITTLLLAIIALPVLKIIPAISAISTIALVCIISIASAYLYFRHRAVQLFLSYLTPAAIIFPLLFLFNSQLSHLLFEAEPPLPVTTDIKSRTPVVMIIFDELPVSTLMSGENQIDRKLFPGFASLADSATWYINTATVAEYTVQAIPAILTGNLPSAQATADHPKRSLSDWMNMPSYRYHPRNLFTALGPNYEFRVFESVSSLCPESLCTRAHDHSVSLRQSIVSLAGDLFVIYLHIILPEETTAKLPRIDMNWSDFIGNHAENIKDDIHTDDVSSFQRFIDALTPSDRPALYFHHTTFPHNPWKFLPSGKEYNLPGYSPELSTGLTWKENADLREPYQRHLLQSMFADMLLGSALEKLKAEGMYDDALIIVTSDHGASFRHGESFRSASQKNYADIMDVPLFIKHPGQRQAAIDTSQLQSIDIVATLFEALQETYPWTIDGQAPTSKTAVRDQVLPLFPRKGPAKSIAYDPASKFATVKWKIGLFGNNGISGIYAGPEHGHLIGQPVNEACAHEQSEMSVASQHLNTIVIDTASAKVNSLVKITTPTSFPQSGAIAVTANERIAAVLAAELLPAHTDHIYTMIDEHTLQSGINRLSVSALLSSENCKEYNPTDMAYDR